MRSRNLSTFKYFQLLCVLAFGIAQCSDTDFKSTNGQRNIFNASEGAGEPAIEEPKEEKYRHEDAFRTIEPVLAVRQAACISCHANITGDLVTDFMYGTNRFFGAVDYHSTSHDRFWSPSFRADAFQNMNVDGRFIVPKVNVESNYVASMFDASAPLTIAKALIANFRRPIFAADQTTETDVEQLKIISSVGKNRDKSKPGVNEIREAKVTIAPPTTAQMESVFKKAKKSITKSGNAAILVKDDSDEISGLLIQQGASADYVTNGSTTTCKGDVFIRGTAVFKDLRISTDDNGCRMYIIGSVYIIGGITYDSDVNSSHLQIVTPKPIFMGIKRIEQRADFSKPGNKYFTMAEVTAERNNVAAAISDDAGPFLVMYENNNLSQIIAVSFANLKTGEDNVAINPTQWQALSGASLAGRTCSWEKPQPGHNCVINHNTDYQRKSFDFEHVLFVTPELHSRYKGLFKGSVVAVAALFTLGELRFEYDETLRNKKILPVLAEEFFSVK